MDRLMLRVAEAAAKCGCSRSVGYQLAHGEWAGFTVRVGKSLRVVDSGLQAWVAAKHEEAARLGSNGVAKEKGAAAHVASTMQHSPSQ